MKYSKQYIDKIAKQTGFVANNVEKVIRLFDTLDFIFSKSSFKDALVLKGGTAINLIYANLPRLSVDIDLDYHRYLDKQKAVDDRKTIIDEMDDYMLMEGYEISAKSRANAILTSRTYGYSGASNNKDNIKIEINFIDRISLYPSITSKINLVGKSISVATLAKEELYGMKIAALIDRAKPRDLYDINHLFMHLGNINWDRLKKSSIFYLSLDGIYHINPAIFENINGIDQLSVKRELLLVLMREDGFNLRKAKSAVLKNLGALLSLSEEESLYLEKFSEGEYAPGLLFDDDVAENASKHPMALWKIINLNH